jgi:hypothetical protein
MGTPEQPLDSLDGAFTIGDSIEDTRWRNLYEVLIHRMRREAADLPMNTVQQLLIERIARNYIELRIREDGGLEGFTSASAQKEFNTFWLSMTQEFNRMITKQETLSGNERKTLLRDIQQTILKTVNNSVTDPKTRSTLLVNMAAAFEHVKI